MAEPVIVPVQLEVTDINMSNLNLADVQKDITAKMSGIKQSITNAFRGIDASAINKPIESAMTAVKKSVQTAEDAQLRYNQALIQAGKSTEEYKATMAASKAAIANQIELVNQLSQLGPAAAPVLKEATAKLNEMVVAQKQINPVDFVDKAQPIELAKVANAYQKLVTAISSVEGKSEKFNQTVRDNRLSDSYQEMVKQAEVYKKKLEELDAKSKRMQALGATDKQWEALRYDTEMVSSEMDKLIAKMREAVKTGSALRFGDGPKADLSRQINSFAMSSQNRAGNIAGRAQNNESPYTKDYQTALNDLDKLEQKINKLNEKYREMQALGKLTPDGLAKMKYDAEQLQGQLDASKTKLTEMVNNGTAFKLGTGNTETELNGINTRLTESRTKLDEINGATATMPAHLSNVSGVIQSLSKTVNKLAAGFIKAVTGCALLGKQGKSTGTSLSKIFNKLKRSVLMYGFGFRSAYVAIRRLRTLVVKEFKLLAQSHSDINAQITSLTMAFNTLKGSIATAFQPLASVVIPILKTAMNYLTGVLESIGRFIATLTGQSYIYKAVAKNIDSVADSAKEANKQLGSYDKLEVINKDNGGKDLSDELGIDYEKVGIEGGSNFAKLIKEAWEKQDFTEVGLTIGNKLVEALNSVPWESIRTGAKNIATSVATLINGFFATPDLGQSIGTSIANALGTAIDFAHTALSTLNFEQIGQVAGNAINSFVEKMSDEDSWAEAGQSVSKAIRGIITTIKTTLETTDWFAVGQAIGTYISNIEWGKVIWDFTTLVGAVLKAIGEALIGWAKEDPLSFIFVAVIVAIAGALTAAAKLFELLKTFTEIKKVLDATGLLKGSKGAGKGAAESIDETAANTEKMSNSTSNLTSKLTSLVKNLALGLVILLEVVAAAVIFVGAIWLLGVMLEQVGIAWEPVLANGEVVGAAVLLGTLLLAGIGVAVGLLGSLGGAMCGQIAIGIAVLAELGVAAGLFIAEVWAIGWGLGEVYKAWQPIHDKGAEIRDYILIGTGLLVAIGVVTAALGVATVASAGALPLAIGLGTALLVELAAAFVVFVASLVEVADQLRLELHPALDLLNAILPGLKTNMHDFTEFMKDFAGEVVTFTAANTIASIGATVDKVVDFFTADPIKTLYKEVDKETKQFNQLIPALEKINPLIDKATKLVGEYKAKMGSFGDATGTGSGGLLGSIVSGSKNVVNGLLDMIERMTNGIIKGINALIKGLNKIKFDVPDWVPAIGGKKLGFNIKEISQVSIPRLAQGAVIPPNKEFLAMLGDQKHGTNIEAPLDTIKQALAEVLAEVGGGNREPIVLQVNGRTLAQVVWDEQAKRYKQTGKYSPVY